MCGETVAGRIMTRTVMDVYEKKDILSVQTTNHSIRIKTPRAVLTLKGADIGSTAEAFKRAVGPDA